MMRMILAGLLCVASAMAQVHIDAGSVNDRYFAGGTAYTYPNPVAGDKYPTMRYGQSFTYTIPLAPGDYVVTLSFVERIVSAPGAHVFNVSLNSAAIIQNLDIWAEASGAPVTRTFAETIDSPMVLAFTTVTRNAIINAIDIQPVVKPVPPTAYTINFTDQTTVKVPGPTHKLGKSVVVACYDGATGGRVTPEVKVDPSSADVVVSFAVAQTGYCVILGGTGPSATVACTTWLVTGTGPAVSGCPAAGTVALGGPVRAKPGDTIRLVLSVTGNPDTGAAAMQWTLTVPFGYVASIVAGPVAVAAGKTLACIENASRCVLAGRDAARIANGEVAVYQVRVPATATGTVRFALLEWIAATPDGEQVPPFQAFDFTVQIG